MIDQIFAIPKASPRGCCPYHPKALRLTSFNCLEAMPLSTDVVSATGAFPAPGSMSMSRTFASECHVDTMAHSFANLACMRGEWDVVLTGSQ